MGQFGGLNLIDDPGEVGLSGAIDLLNVDFDQRGRVHTRDGYAKFTTAAAAGTYHTLAPFYTTSGTKQLIAAFGGASGAINALNTSGGIVAAQAFVNSTYASIARFGGPTTEVAYVAVSGSGAATVYRWNGAAWATPGWTGTAPTGRHLATTSDFRLANARRNGTAAGDNPSTVRFSAISSQPAIATPETWNANDYVDVSPGDGEEIMALVAWGNELFAFKQTKFAVFYSDTTDSSGNPVFNFRLVNSQGLAPSVGGNVAYRAICTSPQGIYFANRRGIWLTTGGPAQLISRQVDPIFRGGVPSFFGSSALNQGSIDQSALVWHDEKLWFAFPSGSSTTNDRVLRFDPVTGNWSLYDFPASAMASFRIGNSEELVFSVGATAYLPAPQAPTVSSQSLSGSLNGATDYYYKVTALNAAGETIASSEAHWVANGFKTLRIAAFQVVGATGYRLYRGTSPGGEDRYISIGNVTSYDDDGTAATTLASPPVSNTAAVAGADVARHSSSYTSDGGDGTTTGAAINSRYRSGFESLAPPRRYIDRYGFGPSRKRIRSWKVTGTGTVTMAVSNDYGAAVGSQSLTLGTSPAVAESRYQRAIRGEKVSFSLSATTAWTVDAMVALLADTKGIAENTPSDA